VKRIDNSVRTSSGNAPSKGMKRFPGGKSFAFTIYDDTDEGTVENLSPVYRLLSDQGIRITKSVWPLANVPGAKYGGATLQDPLYLDFVRNLQAEGFEIALHNVRNSNAPREVVLQGLTEFDRLLGHLPMVHANHSSNRENIYWGSARLSRPIPRLVYNAATRFRCTNKFQGHIPDSEFFWGDLCREHIRYVRNFSLDEINLDRVNPTQPYHDPSRPFVNFWFSSSDCGDLTRFCKLLSEPNQDRLAAEGGICIVFTHFGLGFSDYGKLHPGFETLMRRLSAMNGWFVPVTELLDYLRSQRATHDIAVQELASLESRWLLYKFRAGADHTEPRSL